MNKWMKEWVSGLFGAAPAAYGGSQARDRIGAVAAGLHHSHSNTGSFNALTKARDWTHILMHTSQILNPPSHNGNSFSSN